MRIRNIILSVVFLLMPALAGGTEITMTTLCNDDINFAVRQYTLMLDDIGRKGPVRLPKTIDKMSRRVMIPIDDWCSGFFAGSLW